MRARTLILLFFAIVLAGGTAFLTNAWLRTQALKEHAEGAPMVLPTPAKSVLVARTDIRRGQILRPDEMVWQTWPEGGLDKTYIVMGGAPPRTPETFAGWVAKNPIAGGNRQRTELPPATAAAPRCCGRACGRSRCGTITSGDFRLYLSGDQVDLMLLLRSVEAGKRGEVNWWRRTVLRDIRVIAIDQRLEASPAR
jgi:pilus assembly protein CpaB